MNSEFPISTRMVENCQMKKFLGKNFKIIILGALLLVKKMLSAKKPIIYLLKSNCIYFNKQLLLPILQTTIMFEQYSVQCLKYGFFKHQRNKKKEGRQVGREDYTSLKKIFSGTSKKPTHNSDVAMQSDKSVTI